MRLSPRLCAALAFCALAKPAMAHVQVGVAGGLVSGFLHPLSGADHLIAMVAVGIWGAVLGNPAIWVLPITFPLVMTLGGVIGIAGVPLPQTEVVVGLSGLALGALVAMRVKAPLWAAGILVALFATFHGHAHGAELPNAANPLAYAVGFVAATGLLHLCGIALGVATRWPAGLRAIQGVGAVIAALGAFFLATALGVV